MRDFQGYGLYMLEEVTYDDKGHVTSAGADRYKIPSVADIPRELNVYLLKDSGNPKAVYSSKVRVKVRVMVPPSPLSRCHPPYKENKFGKNTARRHLNHSSISLNQEAPLKFVGTYPDN